MFKTHQHMIFYFATDIKLLDILLAGENVRYIKEFTKCTIFECCPQIAEPLLRFPAFLDDFFNNKHIISKIENTSSER